MSPLSTLTFVGTYFSTFLYLAGGITIATGVLAVLAFRAKHLTRGLGWLTLGLSLVFCLVILPKRAAFAALGGLADDQRVAAQLRAPGVDAWQPVDAGLLRDLRRFQSRFGSEPTDEEVFLRLCDRAGGDCHTLTLNRDSRRREILWVMLRDRSGALIPMGFLQANAF